MNALPVMQTRNFKSSTLQQKISSLILKVVQKVASPKSQILLAGASKK